MRHRDIYMYVSSTIRKYTRTYMYIHVHYNGPLRSVEGQHFNCSCRLISNIVVARESELPQHNTKMS